MKPPFPIRPFLASILFAALVAFSAGSTAGIDDVERIYLDARELKDAIKTIRAHGGIIGPDVSTLPVLIQRYGEARNALMRELQTEDESSLSEQERRAIEAMRRAVENELGPEVAGMGALGADGSDAAPDCTYDPAALAALGFEALSERIHACFGHAAQRLVFDGVSLDRLTVFALLSITDDHVRRRQLFLSLQPIWDAVNGNGGPDSPWRTLVRLSVARFQDSGTSIEGSAALLGVDPAQVEPWLVSILEAWRDATLGDDLEPWDYAYVAGVMDRTLAPHLPLESLRPLNDRVYRELGADPAVLGVAYDIAPRPGKYPIAYSDFASRPRFRPGSGWTPGASRVSASYATGGAGNLAELLHETGHAIHIAAIRTRPAFADWPDSDTYTEALADLISLDLYDPAWQQHYLGTSVAPADALRAKYSGIVKDTAWALFEMHMHRDPTLDPNRVWTDLTQKYLHIRPHPQWSWWAVRGQLVNRPGYMLNYALGAILVADLRAGIRELFGARPWGDPGWYARISERLYRYGLERPSRRVIEEFLGRPVSPDVLLRELRGR